MPAKRKAETVKWHSKRYREGYVCSVRGTAYLRHGDDMKTTRMAFIPANEKQCVKLLDEWIDLKFNDPATFYRKRRAKHWREYQKTNVEDMTVYDAFREYATAKLADASENVKTRWRIALKFWFPSDMDFDYDKLYEHIIKRKAEATFSKSYMAKQMQIVDRLMVYAVKRGILKRNPMELIDKPAVIVHEPETFTEDEMKRIFAWFDEPVPDGWRDRETANKRKWRYGAFVKLLYKTAMRLGEALALEKSDVTPEYIRIRGKGDYVREFPLRHFPDVKELIDEVIERTPYGTKLFKFTEQSARRYFITACEHCDVPLVVNGRKRTLHKLRASAEEVFESKMHLPINVITDIAGHSVATYKKHYRRRMRAEQINSAIERVKGN